MPSGVALEDLYSQDGSQTRHTHCPRRVVQNINEGQKHSLAAAVLQQVSQISSKGKQSGIWSDAVPSGLVDTCPSPSALRSISNGRVSF